MEYDDMCAFMNMMYPQKLYNEEPQEHFRFWFEDWLYDKMSRLPGWYSAIR